MKRCLIKISWNFFYSTYGMLLLCLLSCFATNAQLTTLSENFDTFPTSGWADINLSYSPSNNAWRKPTKVHTADIGLLAHSGDSSSYAVVDFSSISDTVNSGTLSVWLITPVLSLQNGAQIKFWTRTFEGSPYPDRMEVRLVQPIQVQMLEILLLLLEFFLLNFFLLIQILQ